MNDQYNYRKRQLNRLKKAAPVQLKKLCFLLKMNPAHIPANLTPAELSMLIIQFSEENNIQQSLEQEMFDLKINPDTDSDIINSQIKNDMDKFIIREENIGFLTDRGNPRIRSADNTSALPQVASSTVDGNCMFKFLTTYKRENLRGLDICDLITLLMEQDVNGISQFLCHTISFLGMNKQKYFQLLDALYELKPYPE